MHYTIDSTSLSQIWSKTYFHNVFTQPKKVYFHTFGDGEKYVLVKGRHARKCKRQSNSEMHS